MRLLTCPVTSSVSDLFAFGVNWPFWVKVLPLWNYFWLGVIYLYSIKSSLEENCFYICLSKAISSKQLKKLIRFNWDRFFIFLETLWITFWDYAYCRLKRIAATPYGTSIITAPMIMKEIKIPFRSPFSSFAI